MMEAVRAEIAYFTGGEGYRDGLNVRFESKDLGELLNRLSGNNDAAVKNRWHNVERSLGHANGLTACIVILPGADRFKKSGSDPKTALRMGLARSGRLSQFLLPATGDDSGAHRITSAIRDLMRQLGFMPEFKNRNRNGLNIRMPVNGIRVYNSSSGKKTARFPVSVRMEVGSGLTTAYSPLFENGPVPYWHALLELARISTSPDYLDSAHRANGIELKYMVDAMLANDSADESLLLIQAYGCIRWGKWWPGISDGRLASGPVTYGPEGNKSEIPGNTGGLSILKVRSGADGKVPDYFTDEHEQS